MVRPTGRRATIRKAAMLLLICSTVVAIGIYEVWAMVSEVAMAFGPPPLDEIFGQFEADLRTYIGRVKSGEEFNEETRQYRIPEFLIRRMAKEVEVIGDCIVIRFSFMPCDAVPELWYSAAGFDPLPQRLLERREKHYFQFKQLASDWGYCRWDM